MTTLAIVMLFMYIAIHVISSLSYELTPNQPNTIYAEARLLTQHPNEGKIINNNWILNASQNTGWLMGVTINNNYPLIKTSQASTAIITIEGSSNSNPDIIITFSLYYDYNLYWGNNNNLSPFWSLAIPMSNTDDTMIYPQCGTPINRVSPIYGQANMYWDMESRTTSRWETAANTWYSAKPINQNNQWNLQFTLIHQYPNSVGKSGDVQFDIANTASNEPTSMKSCFFKQVALNAYMDIYITTKQDYVPLSISKIKIDYVTTLPPTNSPIIPAPTASTTPQPTTSNPITIEPTNNPSGSPTNNPLKSPTNNPSGSPTNMPSNNPSMTTTTDYPTSGTSNIMQSTSTQITTANPTLIPSMRATFLSTALSTTVNPTSESSVSSKHTQQPISSITMSPSLQLLSPDTKSQNADSTTTYVIFICVSVGIVICCCVPLCCIILGTYILRGQHNATPKGIIIREIPAKNNHECSPDFVSSYETEPEINNSYTAPVREAANLHRNKNAAKMPSMIVMKSISDSVTPANLIDNDMDEMDVDGINMTDDENIRRMTKGNVFGDAGLDSPYSPYSPYSPHSPHIDTESVRTWLTYKVGLPQYLDIFMQNGYDNLNIIQHIDDRNELKDIGIDKKGHQLKIIREVSRLKTDFMMQQKSDRFKHINAFRSNIKKVHKTESHSIQLTDLSEEGRNEGRNNDTTSAIDTVEADDIC